MDQQVPRWSRFVGCLAGAGVLILALIGFTVLLLVLLRWLVDVARSLPF